LMVSLLHVLVILGIFSLSLWLTMISKTFSLVLYLSYWAFHFQEFDFFQHLYMSIEFLFHIICVFLISLAIYLNSLWVHLAVYLYTLWIHPDTYICLH
jgi:hypothetical protein